MDKDDAAKCVEISEGTEGVYLDHRRLTICLAIKKEDHRAAATRICGSLELVCTSQASTCKCDRSKVKDPAAADGFWSEVQSLPSVPWYVDVDTHEAIIEHQLHCTRRIRRRRSVFTLWWP